MLGDGLLAELPAILGDRAPSHRYAVLTDSNVGNLYGTSVQQSLGGSPRCELFSFPAGEASKTRGTWASITDRMLSKGFGRDSTVLALGGGVTGDMAGFVASTFLRGVPCVQIPTSLLAMVDSSVGGKTGVDTEHGKNLVGTFSQPAVVLVDPSTLKTLPDAHVSAAMAEALKHGAIADVAYLDWILQQHERILAREPEAMLEVVRRSIEIKAGIVSEDETEQGRRAILNFGHTVGHAFETATEFEILHGEGLGLGMLAEVNLGIRLGITDSDAEDRLRSGITSLKLPLRPPRKIATSTLLTAMDQDKKNRSGAIRFSLLERLGSVARGPAGAWTHEASKKEISAALEGLL